MVKNAQALEAQKRRLGGFRAFTSFSYVLLTHAYKTATVATPQQVLLLVRVGATMQNPEVFYCTTPCLVNNVREIFDPRMSDLAFLFETTSQDLYAWIQGASVPSKKQYDTLVALSSIADTFQAAGVRRRSWSLMQCKFFEGRSLLSLLRSGESVPEHTTFLIVEDRKRQAAYERSGAATSRAPITDD